MRPYSIGEVSAITQISRDRIRNYEKQGIICPGRDKENDYRMYSERDIAMLQAVETYRFADFGIDDISAICTQTSVEDIMKIAMSRSDNIDRQINELKILKQRNLDITNKCRLIRENLNILCVRTYDDFEILGELDDYMSFDEYSRIYSADESRRPVVYKLQRMITFDPGGIKTNKMVITRPKDHPEKIRCLYMIVKDGENTDDAMKTAFPKCLDYCKANDLIVTGTVYIGMLLIMCEDRKISTYLEIKAPIK
ncbi:MAG: MerR family transcriptional regulator [Oscillospiraceae bacterium]|nr:MerR family transcriptional regulator [Oscillospiraceae bacterium]